MIADAGIVRVRLPISAAKSTVLRAPQQPRAEGSSVANYNIMEKIMSMVDGKHVLASGSVMFNGVAVIEHQNVPTVTVRTLFVESDPQSVHHYGEAAGIALVANLPENAGQHGNLNLELADGRSFRVLYSLHRLNNPAAGHLYQFHYTITQG